MTSASFSRPGAFDLSTLSSQGNAGPGAGSATGSFVIEVNEANFNQVATSSQQYPVVLELTVGSDAACQQLDRVLVELTNAAGGRWQLGRINVEEQPRIAQALGVQAVPTVLALIGGQLAPLFQGTRDKSEILPLLDQVVMLAVQSGVTGRARPSAPAEPDEEAAPDPRFAAADAALAAGDYARAVAEFDKLLVANPRDAEAAAGKAQAGLLARTDGIDLASVVTAAEQSPDDRDAQLAAADVELMTGQVDQAFDRLIALIRRLTGDEREQVRLRVVELFKTMDPNDPVLLRHRRNLSSALF